ncbi:MAG: hypothetical protein HY286_04085 [Planctomycetes bacterium]|nr:hypothetical protein [Planctomycetota bacterium]
MSERRFAATRWNPLTRFAFRFFIVYFSLFIFPFPFLYIEYSGYVLQYYYLAAQWIVPRFGAVALKISEPILEHPTGSGDTLFNYVHAALMGSVAAVSAVVWTAIDLAAFNKPAHPRLYECLRILVRYYLIQMFLGYGFAKVFPTQFAFPEAGSLLRAYGDSSPMGLAWSFMGYSTVYQMFTGAAEVLAGLLLMFRRTTSIGSFVGIAVMSNVVMINYCFDVPVKLHSTNYMAMLIFLALSDCRRFFEFSVLNRPVRSARLDSLIFPGLLRYAAMVPKTALILYLLFMNIKNGSEYFKSTRALPEGQPYGIYEVVEFARNGEVASRPAGSAGAWWRMSFSRYGYAAVQSADGYVYRHYFTIKKDTKKLESSRRRTTTGPVETLSLDYTEMASDKLRIEGDYLGEKIRVLLKKVDSKSFPLAQIGFRWIQEYPDNR